jgi:hypothetical protein
MVCNDRLLFDGSLVARSFFVVLWPRSWQEMEISRRDNHRVSLRLVQTEKEMDEVVAKE